MPVHDWKSVPVGLYHHFHQSWAVNLAEGLNAGVLPKGFFALVDQRAIGLIPDVLALKKLPGRAPPDGARGGLALADTPPRVRHVTRQSDRELYAARANRIAVRNPSGEVVTVIELVSPGNKDSKHAIRSFVEKAVEFLTSGINLLVIDLFPPTARDPQGIHKAIWDEVGPEDGFGLPPDKPLTLAAYSAGVPITGYVESVAVGEMLPAMPVFLESATYVPAPLEETYQRTWDKCPDEMKELVRTSTDGS